MITKAAAEAVVEVVAVGEGGVE
eukprot:COSAG06_NODE_13904_length_1206_cov_6.864368_2_plen_22_part_01